ncbi:MAG TPA: ABC transporter substrate-binding protein [Sediminispirochaeta sp.]|nr:ABC transporter substrate-binding protein [Sediminispirochaeta sp.]
MHRYRTFFAALLLVFFQIPTSLSGVEIKYAEGFRITEKEGYPVIIVDLGGKIGGDFDGRRRYILVPRKKYAEFQNEQGFVPIPVPIKSAVSLSSTFLPPFQWFEQETVIVGIDRYDYLYDSEMRRNLNERGVVEVGNGPNLNIERLRTLEPELVMANAVEGEWNVVPKIRRAGLRVFLNGDYLEPSPLGRAEWIKCFGLLLGEEAAAEELFSEVERRYGALASRVSDIDRKPEVLFNVPSGGTWVQPGGGSYMARLLEDAGGSYPWSENDSEKSLLLDIESVFARARDAELWLHQYGITSKEEILQINPVLGRIRAFRRGMVLNNDARTAANGANDFYEGGTYRPDLILRDLVSIFHPSQLPDHKLYYYRPLH